MLVGKCNRRAIKAGIIIRAEGGLGIFYRVCKQVAFAVVELLVSHGCLLNAKVHLRALTRILAQRLAGKNQAYIY